MQKPSGRHLPWTGRITHLVAFMLALLLGTLAVYGRCRQVADQRERSLDRAFFELARVFESDSRDLSRARESFSEAAGVGLTATYPLFCQDALDELQGEPPELGEPPLRWSEAIDLLASGELDEARSLFSQIEREGGSYAVRARYYQRFIGDLARYLESDRSGP